MALGFNQSKGEAIKNKVDSIAFKNGENRIRIVGDILPRYVYWVEGRNSKNLPFECLGFDRASEKFLNEEKDWVRDFYPDKKCGWAYAMQGIDLNEDEPTVKVVNMKKKLWEQIRTAAEDLGDPTDPETGWDIVFDRKKTGPLPYNVEYQLKVLRCKNRPLTDAEKEAIAELKSMDEVMPRPTPDAQKKLLEDLQTAAANVDTEVEEEFDDIDVA